MNGKTLKTFLMDALRRHSGLEARRPYLGMSSISQCPRKLYFDYVEGREPANDKNHWSCWSGYLFENALLTLLGSQFPGHPELAEGEIVADFDSRFRGHVDWVLDGDLVEIKSTNWANFRRIIENGPNQRTIDQVQCYMRHGGFSKAHIIYIARDVPLEEWRGLPIWTFEQPPQPDLADRLDQKAQRVLAAVDKGLPPGCECGWCRR
jgi:hypothetical protein